MERLITIQDRANSILNFMRHDAAPYMHQRLAAVQHTVTNDTIKATPESGMSDEEMADYYNKLRMRSTSVNPLVVDNETGEPVHEDAE